MTEDPLVVYQASGMLSVQLGVSVEAALLFLNVQAFDMGRSVEDIAQQVVERKIRFGL